MAVNRLQYRRRTHYATRSNRIKIVRTPGNRLVAQKRTKRSQGIHTPWVLGHKRLGGTSALNHTDLRLSTSRPKTVSRAYGGVLSHDQVRDRIIRAFLMEEQRIVKKVMKAEAKYQRDKKRRDRKQKKRVERIKAAAKKVGAKVGAKKVLAKKVAPKAGKAAAKPVKAAPKKAAAPAKAAPKKAAAKKA
jgi:large subunit ribosomal protein L34e